MYMPVEETKHLTKAAYYHGSLTAAEENSAGRTSPGQARFSEVIIWANNEGYIGGVGGWERRVPKRWRS